LNTNTTATIVRIQPQRNTNTGSMFRCMQLRSHEDHAWISPCFLPPWSTPDNKRTLPGLSQCCFCENVQQGGFASVRFLRTARYYSDGDTLLGRLTACSKGNVIIVIWSIIGATCSRCLNRSSMVLWAILDSSYILS
jgi:hypothetical protein